MNPHRVLASLITLTAFLVNTGSAKDPTATEIVEKADQHLRGKTSFAEMTMTVIRPDWSREVGIKSWTRGRDYSMILITSPARDKGTTFLMRNKEVWNWIPSIERVIKIPPSMMMQSWMGSDFTNDDLVKESSAVVDYTHKLLGDATLAGRECYKIELTPKPDAPVVWGKILIWITKDNFLELRVEYYNEDGELQNVMEMSDVKMMGGRLIPSVMQMIPADHPDHKTVIVNHKLEFDRPIPDSFFSEQNMKRLH